MDVTRAVATQAAAQAAYCITVPVTNEFLGGDPSPGTRKTLLVTVASYGEEQTYDAREGDKWELVTRSVAGVVTATYGDPSNPARSLDVSGLVAGIAAKAVEEFEANYAPQ